jgi:hypothetical protein
MNYITENPLRLFQNNTNAGAGTGLVAFTLTYKVLSSLHPKIPHIHKCYEDNKDRHVYLSKQIAAYFGISPFIALKPHIIIRHVDSYIKKYIGIDKKGYYIFNETLWNILDVPYNQSLNIMNIGRVLSSHYLNSST